MEQATLPEGEERQLLAALLTKKAAPRKPVTIAEAARLLKGTSLFQDAGKLEAALASLAERGLLETRTKGKQRAYEVPQEVARTLKPPAAPRRARRPSVTLDDLQELESRLNHRLDRIMGMLSPRAAATPGADSKQIEAAIPAAIRDADLQGRHGGLVPIPEVRRLVLQQTGATRAQFDQALLAMEREFRVDLKIADDPRRPDAPEGIQVPGRGLVYYAITR